VSGPGRSCPSHHRYAPSVLARPAELEAETLLVVGGLYGNRWALEAALRLHDREHSGAALVFNGDFNWFNVDFNEFEAINKAVLPHVALRGNVETELADSSDDSGCGCAYPEWIADSVVESSNAIMARLRRTAEAFPGHRRRLAALPMHLVASVGGIRIAIVHGDAESLSGWNFSHQMLHHPDNEKRISGYFQASNARVFASTHTGLPVARDFDLPGGKGVIMNNGTAGLPTFSNTSHGLITRISIRPTETADAVYGTLVDGIYIDALPLRYNDTAWRQSFLTNWSPGSPAFESYFRRISRGPSHTPAQAVMGGIVAK
jgi:hypothetical protein